MTQLKLFKHNSQSDKIIELEKPDAVLLYGDTNSCLSVILQRKQVPFFTWKQVTAVLTKVPEELLEKLLII